MFLPEHFGKQMVDSTRMVKFKMLYTFLHESKQFRDDEAERSLAASCGA
jgi:hypothetical protein